MEDRDNNVREDDDPAVCPESEIMVLIVHSLAISYFFLVLNSYQFKDGAKSGAFIFTGEN